MRTPAETAYGCGPERFGCFLDTFNFFAVIIILSVSVSTGSDRSPPTDLRQGKMA